MTTGAGKIALASRAQRTALALVGGQALVQLAFNAVVSPIVGPAGTVAVSVTMPLKQSVIAGRGPQVLVTGYVNLTCSAPNVEVTITIDRIGAPTIQVLKTDSGGSADHNVQAAFSFIDTPPSSPAQYRASAAAASGTLSGIEGGIRINALEMSMQNYVLSTP